MTSRLTDRDWETLSAYLDSALPPEELPRVQARLGRDVEFMEAYASLLKTRGIMRSVSRIKRRRSFYLTPEMVRPVRWGWLLPTLNYSSMAAGILAFIFLVMDLLPLKGIPVTFHAAKEAPAPQLSAPLQEAAAPAAVIAYTQTPLPSVVANNLAAEEAPAADQFAQNYESAPSENEAAVAGAVPSTPPGEPEAIVQPGVSDGQDTAPSMKLEAAPSESIPLQPLTPTTQEEELPAAPPDESIPAGTVAAPASSKILPTATVMDQVTQPAESGPAMAAEAAIPSPAPELDRGKGVEPTAVLEPLPTGKPVIPPVEKSQGIPFAWIGGALLVLSLLLGTGGFILKRRGRS